MDENKLRSLLNFGRARHRLPIIHQSENAECGLACIAMISNYYGNQISLSDLRQKYRQSQRGASLKQIIDVAQSLGLSCRPLRLEVEESGQLSTPSILHWNLSHFVVLREVTKNHLVIHDPAMGIRKISWADARKRMSGVALELHCGASFQRKDPAPPLSLKKLAGSIHGLWTGLFQIFSLALVLEFIALLAPQFMQQVLDQVIPDNDLDLLTILGLSFIGLACLQTAISAFRSWVVVCVSNQFNLGWTANVYQHLLKLPLPYFLSRHLGDVVSRFGALGVIQQTITTQFVTALLDGLMAVATLVLMLVYSPALCAMAVAALLLYGALRALYFRVYREANLSQIVVNAKQQSKLMESVRGIQTLRLFNQGAAQTSRFLNITADALNTNIQIQRLSLVFDSLSGLTSGIKRVGVLWIGTSLVLHSKLSAGALIAFVAYSEQFSTRAVALIDYAFQFKLLRLQGERLADIVLTPPEPHMEGSYGGPDPQGSVVLRAVSYRYSANDPWILRGCTLKVDQGELVAIVGPSGCGKSTLAKLLLGLLDPLDGVIEVGGVDLRSLGKARYRSLCSSVMQDDRLFAGTIAENIAFFDEALNMDLVEESAKLAAIHEDIAAMPMGYLTLVGDMGDALSGGQRQRLAIARALYTRPKIIVLDEATSSLDPYRERQINQCLASLKITRIVIAHRPETIRQAERVILLVGGQAFSLTQEQINNYLGTHQVVTAAESTD